MYHIMCNIVYLSIDISYDILDHIKGKMAIVHPLSLYACGVHAC